MHAGPENVALDAKTAPAGEIEVRSGSLIVSSRHGLSRGSRPLDARVPPGKWAVTRVFEGADAYFDEGDLGVLLIHRESPSPDRLVWTIATSQGRPARAGEVIGDGDKSVLLGTGPFAASYPMLYGADDASPEQLAEMRTFRQDERNPKLLLPDAQVAAFVTRSAIRMPWFVRAGRAAVWVGRDSGGTCRGVFVDWLSAALEAMTLPSCDDAWAALIPNSDPADLLVGVDTLEEECGDVSSLFERVPEGALRMFNGIDMTGRLHVVPRRESWHANPAEETEVIVDGAPLPVRCHGPVSVLVREVAERDFLTLLRFGDERPTRWAYLPWPNIKHPVLTTDEVIRQGAADEQVRWAFADVSASGYTSTIDRFAAVNWWPTMTGDAPENWLVGLDDAGRVQALAVADNRETTTFTVRPAETDRSLLLRLRTTDIDDAEFEEYMTDFETHLSEEGSMTPGLRGELHWLARRFLD